MAIYQLGERRPQIDGDAFVAEEATIIGDVRIAAGCSIWPGAVLRGDNEPLEISAGCNIQEGAVLHTDPGCPLRLGPHVTVGHQAMLHGCLIDEGTLIGIQAVVLNKARLGKRSLVGACALVTEGKSFPDQRLIRGVPAQDARALTDEEADYLLALAHRYAARGRYYREHLKRLDPE